MFTIEILRHISAIQNNVGDFSTEPKIAYDDEQVRLVIKVHNCIQGNLVLFNEYFCYRLAKLVEINMPRSGICVIDEKTTIFNKDITDENYGKGFFSTYIDKNAPLMESIIPMMKNKEEFFKILLFDHIIYNKDRNPGNLFVRYYKNNISLYVIDHSHVFVNQAIWEQNCLRRGIEERDYFNQEIMESNSYLYNMFFSYMNFQKDAMGDIIALFRENITLEAMQDIINDIPVEWLPSEDDVNMLVEYILYRLSHLEDICITIEKYLNA